VAAECSNCRFFFAFEGSPDESSIGMCKRYAPRPSMSDKTTDSPEVIWPEVDGDDWCGEHAPETPS
jgi:hypothetical protein